MQFADVYRDTYARLKRNPVNIWCRGMEMAYECTDVHLHFDVSHQIISVFSSVESRTTPIAFVLSEFLWILAGQNDLKMVSQFNVSMRRFSDDGETLNGAYGKRIGSQLTACIEKLCHDPFSRQACVAIYYPLDMMSKSKDVPCNVILQFLIREGRVNLHVVARSSDFITGLCIDSCHWQALLILVTNSLNAKDFGGTLSTGSVFYTIHSLHVYGIDKDTFDRWNMDVQFAASYQFSISGNYEQWVQAARADLANVKDLDGLMNLWGLAGENREVVKFLQEQHKDRKYRIER